jgi:DNA-binding transcriptional MerR regulator
MKQRQTWQISEAARLAGVSVRTLHHYDAIGLLVPKLRSAAGYRLYDREDLLRLQQIIIGRELGLSLQEIGRSLDDPRFDLGQALRAQRQQLQGRVQRTAAVRCIAAWPTCTKRMPDLRRTSIATAKG